MDKLKIGDIKKFKIGDKEFVGVVVGIGDKILEIIDLNGGMIEVPFNRPLSYGATRLDPKLRTQLETIAEINKKYDKLTDEIKKLELERNKQLDKMKKEISKLLEVQGKFRPDELANVFLNKLKKANPSLHKKLTREDSKGYSLDVAKTPVGVWLKFRRSDYFAKWVSVSSYDFLYKEYDGQLMISGETKQYKDLCKKMGKDDADFTMSDLKGKFKVERGIYAGDKDSLTYVNTIYILLPYDCLTESYIDKLIATIKY